VWCQLPTTRMYRMRIFDHLRYDSFHTAFFYRL
jgi:hypothetical protein